MRNSGSQHRVLVCAAHPDDEVLGCGATIAKHAAAGDIVRIFILGQGLFSRTDGTVDEHAMEDLRVCARNAAKILGALEIEFEGLPDNRFDAVDRLDVVKMIEARVARDQPDIVYTHYPADLNVDHGRVAEAVMTACRPIPGMPVRSLRFFEVQSSTEWRVPAAGVTAFAPNLFVDVTATLARKLDALRAYAGEMRQFPHARSLEAVEHLARWRGACAGFSAAEAFVVARQLET